MKIKSNFRSGSQLELSNQDYLKRYHLSSYKTPLVIKIPDDKRSPVGTKNIRISQNTLRNSITYNDENNQMNCSLILNQNLQSQDKPIKVKRHRLLIDQIRKQNSSMLDKIQIYKKAFSKTRVSSPMNEYSNQQQNLLREHLKHLGDKNIKIQDLLKANSDLSQTILHQPMMQTICQLPNEMIIDDRIQQNTSIVGQINQPSEIQNMRQQTNNDYTLNNTDIIIKEQKAKPVSVKQQKMSTIAKSYGITTTAPSSKNSLINSSLNFIDKNGGQKVLKATTDSLTKKKNAFGLRTQLTTPKNQQNVSFRRSSMNGQRTSISSPLAMTQGIQNNRFFQFNHNQNY